MHDTRERRTHRSSDKREALRLLLEAVKARSQVSAIAVIDGRGLVASGAGSPRELAILGAVAEPISSGLVTEACEHLTSGTDVLARPVRTPRGTMYLAALGERVTRMHDAARGVERILAS